jgi:MSHA biogenesis protein MshK
VNLGEKFGDARVVKISESEVVLRNGSNLQTLKLFPGLEKQLNSTHDRPDRNAAAIKAQ